MTKNRHSQARQANSRTEVPPAPTLSGWYVTPAPTSDHAGGESRTHLIPARSLPLCSEAGVRSVRRLTQGRVISTHTGSAGGP